MVETERAEVDDTGTALRTDTWETHIYLTRDAWKFMLAGRVCRYEVEQVEVPVTYWYTGGWQKAWAQRHPDKTITIWRFTVTEPDNGQGNKPWMNS